MRATRRVNPEARRAHPTRGPKGPDAALRYWLDNPNKGSAWGGPGVLRARSWCSRSWGDGMRKERFAPGEARTKRFLTVTDTPFYAGTTERTLGDPKLP